MQDRGTDVRCIVAVCADGRGPGAAFVSLAFKSTRSHSAASCLPSVHPPPSSSPWREGRDVCVCLCVWAGLPWLKGRVCSSPFCPPFSHR